MVRVPSSGGSPRVSRPSYIFTSESVSEGHPDKVADRISDTVVDAFLTAEPEARVACETLVTTNRIVLAGEVRAGTGRTKAIRLKGSSSPRSAPRSRTSATSRRASTGRRPSSPATCTNSRPTSPRASTPPTSKDEGAGDQGIMFGYATRRDRRS